MPYLHVNRQSGVLSRCGLPLASGLSFFIERDFFDLKKSIITVEVKIIEILSKVSLQKVNVY